MQELYSFMDAANSTLDAGLEEDAGNLSPSSSLRGGSLPPSLKATPRSLPSEVSCDGLKLTGSGCQKTAALAGCAGMHRVAQTAWSGRLQRAWTNTPGPVPSMRSPLAPWAMRRAFAPQLSMLSTHGLLLRRPAVPSCAASWRASVTSRSATMPQVGRHGPGCATALWACPLASAWFYIMQPALQLRSTSLARLSGCAEALFKPLQDTVALLDRFGNQLEPELLGRLDDVPRQWRLLSKKMFM